VEHTYGVRDVERLLHLSRGTIRSLIAAGFVAPARGPRGAFQFSFQDLIVLRTARALVDAQVPRRRITRSLRELRRHLPDAMPLSGLSIGAVADRVVVREGGSRWQAESGQYLLEFDGDPAAGAMSVIERAAAPADVAGSAQAWFERGVVLEKTDLDEAVQAYLRAIEEDAAHLDARVNLGRLLHESKHYAAALRAYRDALDACGPDPLLLFNLGVLFEDMDRLPDAALAYEAALAADPDLADGHYNLALLRERQGKPKDAIRHMARYRMLTGHRAK
jgi:tetratricopeptide (TPR) repeat protein